MRAGERESLNSYQVDVLCPITYGESLTSLLVVGLRRDDSPYSDEQLELIMTVANGVAVAIENARIVHSLRKQQQRTEQLLSQVVAAQEEERQRIAGELHDGVAQSMVRLLYQVQVASALLARDNGDDARQELDGIEEIISVNIKEIRRALVGLSPPDLEQLGLLGAIQREVNRFKQEAGDCSWELVGEPVPLPKTVDTAIYRIVQEGLNNVRNYAEASKVSLKIEFRDRQILLELRDNGRGFDVSRTLEGALSDGHLGVWGITQRAQALGGSLIIDSAPGAGTAILLDLPLETPQPEVTTQS